MKIKDLDNYCVIKWRLTDVCNYKCSYCIRRGFIKDISSAEYDFYLDMLSVEDVKRIAEELNAINNKMIKIDLIGGEISVFPNFDELLGALCESDYIEEINITTNFSASKEYYLNLVNIAQSYGKILSITASFHYEQSVLDIFMDKAKALHEALNKHFKCETVITKDNTYVEDFITQCNQIGCYYMCEEDLLDQSKNGQGIKNYKSENRYLVTFEDGSEQYFTTRNEVLKRFGKDGMVIETKNHKCSRDKDFVYIEKNMAIPCHNKIPIGEYSVSAEMQKCKHGYCSLCGHMSIEPIGQDKFTN